MVETATGLAGAFVVDAFRLGVWGLAVDFLDFEDLALVTLVFLLITAHEAYKKHTVNSEVPENYVGGKRLAQVASLPQPMNPLIFLRLKISNRRPPVTRRTNS